MHSEDSYNLLVGGGHITYVVLCGDEKERLEGVKEHTGDSPLALLERALGGVLGELMHLHRLQRSISTVNTSSTTEHLEYYQVPLNT
jgi:hypothetical protein